MATAWPDDVVLRLLRGLGAYIRATPTQELPPSVRRLKGFRQAALNAHRDSLLNLLNDEGMRALILEWLDDDKPSLKKEDAELLRVATARPQGWQKVLSSDGSSAEQGGSSAASEERLTKALERERDKARRAKEEVQKIRRDGEVALRAEKARTAEAVEALQRMTSERDAALARVEELEKRLRTETAAIDRSERKARRDAERAREQAASARNQLKLLKKELAAAQAKLRAFETGDAGERPPAARQRKPKEPRGPRKPLSVPKGRLADAKETLDEWLGSSQVHLLVDGYNVTKAERGFGTLELSAQRDRLVQEVTKLARKKKAKGTIVFDGNEVPPGIARTARGAVKVEYSRTGEIADDHIVALLESLPPRPVVLVTNDRELQERGAALGATIATSDQLLELIH